jgi:hypothetical protein
VAWPRAVDGEAARIFSMTIDMPPIYSLHSSSMRAICAIWLGKSGNIEL